MNQYTIHLDGAVHHVEAEGFKVKDHLVHFFSGDEQQSVATFPCTATIDMKDDSTTPETHERMR